MLFDEISEWAKWGCFQNTSYPCSLPRFIMSLHSLGTWDIRSTAFCEEKTNMHTTKPVWPLGMNQNCFNFSNINFFLSFLFIYFFYKNLKCNQLILWLTIFFKKTSEHFIFTSICWQSNPAFMLYFKKSLSNKINCTLIKHFYLLLVSIAASKTSFLLYL